MSIFDAARIKEAEVEFGAYITQLRERRGMTKADLAYACRSHGAKWAPSCIYVIEKGKKPFTPFNMVSLSLGLDVPVETLYSRLSALVAAAIKLDK
jgi:hypothetical protein